jgi:hypothetical protein
VTTQILAALDDEISRLTQARTLLAGRNGATGAKDQTPGSIKALGVKRILSPEARKRIVDAQRKRWAAYKKAAK